MLLDFVAAVAVAALQAPLLDTLRLTSVDPAKSPGLHPGR
jgi:hypothetical protein